MSSVVECNSVHVLEDVFIYILVNTSIPLHLRDKYYSFYKCSGVHVSDRFSYYSYFSEWSTSHIIRGGRSARILY